MLKVAVPSSFDLSKISRYGTAFGYCHNLQTFSIPDIVTAKMSNLERLIYCFVDCKNLTTVKFRLPQSIMSMQQVFLNCSSLSGDILDLLPMNGFSGNLPNTARAFCNTALSCSDYERLGQYFWNSGKYWQNNKVVGELENLLSTTLSGCFNMDMSLIPTEFGGDNNDIVQLTPKYLYNVAKNDNAEYRVI